jgi:hypothetical protein
MKSKSGKNVWGGLSASSSDIRLSNYSFHDKNNFPPFHFLFPARLFVATGPPTRTLSKPVIPAPDERRCGRMPRRDGLHGCFHRDYYPKGEMKMKTIELSLDCCVVVPDDFQDDEVEVVVDEMQRDLLATISWSDEFLFVHEPPLATWTRHVDGSLVRTENDASLLADQNPDALEPVLQQ